MKRSNLLFLLFLTLISFQLTAQDDGIVFDIEQQATQHTVNHQHETRSAKSVTLLSGVLLEYTEQGDASGIPVVLLHGFTDSRRSFDLLLPSLPASLHVFTISLRGHGNSTEMPEGYRPADFAADLNQFMEAANLSSAVIVGHSMGSAVAQQFALGFPQRVKALVLTGAFVNFRDKPVLAELEKSVARLKDPIDISFIHAFQKSTLARPAIYPFFETILQEQTGSLLLNEWY